MPPAGPRAVLPGPIRQNGHVVRDLDRSIESWLELGVGPWLVLRHLEQLGSTFRGQSIAPVVSMAFANSGDLQVELIAPEDDSPSVYREFLDAGREGLHHHAWWAEDFRAVADAATGAGWIPVQGGNVGGMAEFIYFDPFGGSSLLVEVMELTDATRWLIRTVEEAARDWDGSDPVRPLA